MANKAVRSMRITPADNGGYSCCTDHDGDSYDDQENTVHATLDDLHDHLDTKFGGGKKSKKHPGFKGVESKIEHKEGVSQKAAGAILASSSRHASAGAKKSNPRLNRVK